MLRVGRDSVRNGFGWAINIAVASGEFGVGDAVFGFVDGGGLAEVEPPVLPAVVPG